MADPHIETYDPEHEATSAAITESRPARAVFMAIAFVFLALFLVLPLVVVFNQAFAKGLETYLTSLNDGDTLSAISKKFYGDANKYNRIFEANRDILKDPDHIKPGQSLKIPTA